MTTLDSPKKTDNELQPPPKTCTGCGGTGPFGPDKRAKDGLRLECEACYAKKTGKTELKELPPKAAPVVVVATKEPVKAVAKEPIKTTKAPAKAAVKGPSQGSQTTTLLHAYLKKIGQKPVEKNDSTQPYVASGSIILDNIIGGSMARDGKGFICPGYPRRKYTEIYGPESSGKTTVALAAAAQVQRNGGSVLFIDFEHSLHSGYAQSIGVKYDDTFTLVAPITLEQGLEVLHYGIKAGIDLIIVDSVAAMVTKNEMEKGFDDEAKIGSVSKKLSEWLPKIVIWLDTMPTEGTGESKRPRKGALGTALILLNQERATISTGGGGHGAPEPNSSGGKALKFYAHLRLRFARILTEMTPERMDPATGKKRKFPYGNLTSVKVVKTKVDGKQGYTANIYIRHGFGLDDARSVIESGVASGVIKRDGAYYSYNNERYQGRDAFRKILLGNNALYSELKAKVVKAISFDPTANTDPELSADEEEDSILAQISGDMGGGTGINASPVESDAEDHTPPAEVVVDEEDDEDDGPGISE